MFLKQFYSEETQNPPSSWGASVSGDVPGEAVRSPSLARSGGFCID
jgi:hypothetical protein